MQPPTAEMMAHTNNCYVAVKEVEVAKAKNQQSFTDARDYAIKAMADALNRRDAFASCDDVVVEWESMQGQVIVSANRTIQRGLGLAAIPLGILATAELVKDSAGGSTGDTWTVNGSRVNSKSGNSGGNASSSGTGLGEGNTFDESQGGIQPRNQDDFSDQGSGSNSGEDVDTINPEPELFAEE